MDIIASSAVGAPCHTTHYTLLQTTTSSQLLVTSYCATHFCAAGLRSMNTGWFTHGGNGGNSFHQVLTCEARSCRSTSHNAHCNIRSAARDKKWYTDPVSSSKKCTKLQCRQTARMDARGGSIELTIVYFVTPSCTCEGMLGYRLMLTARVISGYGGYGGYAGGIWPLCQAYIGIYNNRCKRV